jgi:hypothetical protein
MEPEAKLAEMPSMSRVSRRNLKAWRDRQEGRWGYILAWALGVPIPILLVVFVLRGCT